MPFLKGRQLFGHVDGSSSMPPPMLDDHPNPKYTLWLLLDQLLLSAINLSLSDQVLAQVLECTTAQEAWNTLQTLFASQFSAHVMLTHYPLATLKKGSESITDYFHRDKTLAASLGAQASLSLHRNFQCIYLLGLGLIMTP